jgi:hypothetical protein
MRKSKRNSFFRDSSRVMLTTTDFIPSRGRGVKIAIGIIFGIIIMAVLYLLFFSPYFEVRSATVVGNQKISYEDVQKALRDTESARNTLFFPQDNLFLIQSSVIAEKLREEFFIVESVKVQKVFPNIIRVKITEKTPVAVWQQNNSRFYVDQRGYVIDRVDITADTGTIPVVINQVAGDIPTVGDFVIHPDTLEHIATTQKELPAKIGVTAKLFTVPTGFALEYSVQTSEGWDIIFSRERPVSAQLDGLKSMLAGVIGNKRSFLHYVDLRVVNTGYFK